MKAMAVKSVKVISNNDGWVYQFKNNLTEQYKDHIKILGFI